MKKNAILSILLCLCMVASLVLVPVPQAAAAEVDTSKLDGVYEAYFGDLMYTITFDNGTMTIVDAPAAANFPLAGEYTYTVDADGMPIVDTDKFILSKNMGGFLTIQPANFMMAFDMTKVAELGQTPDAPAIDTSKLDGVYEASFSGQVLLVLTFNNGKLTVKDMNMGQVTGDYTYTVDADGIPVVDGNKFLFSKNMGGFLTVQPEGWKLVLDMVKVAELSDVETPDEPAIDTSKLDGVYEVFFGSLVYTMTFDNGKLTIEDGPAAAGAYLAGEYTYTVVDGIPTVEGAKFTFSKDVSGKYTVSLRNFPMPLILNKVAELGGTETPDEPAIDTSKLDGVYEVIFGDLMYTMTFDNGKLTVVDAPAAANFPLAGEYTYTVVDGIPTVEGARFTFSKDMGGNYTLSVKGFPMAMTLTKVAELGGTETPDEPAIDTSKLDGVYNAEFSGQVMYILTFNNGKLTVEDKNMGTLTGEYTYTVDADGIPSVEGNKFMFSKNMGGFLTVQPEGVRFPLDMTKVAELEEEEEPTDTTITVTTTDTYTWIDKFSFTADKAGEYTFIVPAGLSVVNADDKNADPYIDFQVDHDGGEFTVTLAEGQTINFCVSAASKAEWTITWRLETPILSGTINVTTTETYDYNAEFSFTAPADGEYTFTLPAGLGAANADKLDAEDYNDAFYVDYYQNKIGAKFTVTLAEGQTIRFYAGSPVNADWVIEWTNAEEKEESKDNVLVVGENTIAITNAIINEGGVAYTFVVEAAGHYTFKCGDLLIIILNADGQRIDANEADLVPGTYMVQVIMDETVTAGDHTLTITTNAEPVKDPELVMGENTIEYGEEAIKDGLNFVFVVTEAGDYYFDGDLRVVIKDANGVQINIYSSYLEPGEYIISVYNVEGAAGTFTLTVSTKTAEQLEQEAIDRVIALIEAIGEVTIDSKDAIMSACEFYNALSDESKALVTNLSVLEAAEEALAQLENPEDPSDPTDPTTPPTQPTEPTTPAQPTEPTTPATQPNGNGGNEDNGSTIIIVIVVVAVVAVVAVVLLTKKKKA